MAESIETASAVQNSLRAALAEAIRPITSSRRQPVGKTPNTTGSPVALALTKQQWRDIGRDVMALHEGYTQRNRSFAHDANPIHERLAAYQLYFLPRNWYRVHRVIQSLPWRLPEGSDVPEHWLGRDLDQRQFSLLDLGCGSGAFSLAWLAWISERLARHAADGRQLTVRLTLVDQGRELISLAMDNLRAFAALALPKVALQFDAHADGVQAYLGQHPAQQRFAVAGAAMTLNELSLLGPRRVSDRSRAFADAVRNQVRPGGVLMFVEPGTRKGFMNVMALRQHLLQHPVLYPCPHALACPMWAGAVRHWCHATERLPRDFFFDRPLRSKAGLSFQMQELQLSALAVHVVAGSQPVAPFEYRAGARVVSAPMRARSQTQGKHRAPSTEQDRVVLVCEEDGQLHERPAPEGGPYTRGRWQEQAVSKNRPGARS